MKEAPGNTTVTVRRAELADVPAITDIYNEAILTTTATFDTEPKSVAERTQWFQSHDGRHPILVAVADGKVVGWASLTQWSERSAYDDTAETSFYVHSTHRGRGIGRKLKDAIIEEARRLRYHTLIARVAEGSHESIHLNESAGFVHVGTLKEVGRKFGRLLDVQIMQKMLGGPQSCTPTASETITVARAELTANVSRALIGALNAELRGVYSEPGATHFRLDPEEIAGGRGAFLIVCNEGTPVGCGALRLLDAKTAELKRMYISPSVRGRGLGRRLVAALEAEARALGVRRLVLETGIRQAAALALYRATGFHPIPLYGEYCLSPETSVCFGKELVVQDP